MKRILSIPLTGRIVIAGLMGLIARTGPAPQGGTVVIRARGDMKTPVLIAPKKDPPPKHRELPQLHGRYDVKNPRILARLNKSRRGRN